MAGEAGKEMKSELTKDQLFRIFNEAGTLQTYLEDAADSSKGFSIVGYHMAVGRWLELVPLVRIMAMEALYRQNKGNTKR